MPLVGTRFAKVYALKSIGWKTLLRKDDVGLLALPGLDADAWRAVPWLRATTRVEPTTRERWHCRRRCMPLPRRRSRYVAGCGSRSPHKGDDRESLMAVAFLCREAHREGCQEKG